MENPYKYVVLLPISEPGVSYLKSLMDRIATFTKLPPPHTRIIPHVTLHRPLAGVDEKAMIRLTRRIDLKVRPEKVTVGGLSPFGKQYIVLPVNVSLGLAYTWVRLYENLAKLPQYKEGEFDRDNILHVTVAEKTSAVFNVAWPEVRTISVPEMQLKVKGIELYRQKTQGGAWEKVRW